MSAEISLLSGAVKVFGLACAVILVSHRFRVPPIIGFLLTGVLAGPHGLGLVGATEQVRVLAELGVILLLFVIGLELSLEELWRLRRPVFLGGGVQVALTVAVFAAVVFLLGAGLGKSVFIGFLAALSSTAIVLKVLGEKAQLDAPHGRIALGALLFQDVAAIPMMLLVPLLAGTSDNPWQMLGLLSLKALGVGLFVFIVARKVVPVVLHAVIRTRSRELFLITTLGLCFSIAILTAAAGLSLSLGAFLAGLIMSESEYSYSALEGVLPFRDVFTSVFFISIGMLLDPVFAATHLPQVLGLTFAVLIFKAFLAAGSGLVLGYPLYVALLSGLCLCQIGEFSFVLAGVGMANDLLSHTGYQYFLAVAILTMAVTPFLIAALPRLSAWLVRKLPAPEIREEITETEEQGEEVSDHLVIVGYGLGGRHLVRAAQAAGIRYLVLEMNPETVRREHNKGKPVFYGDASQAGVLNHVRIRQARVLAVVISDPTAIGRIVATARDLNPGLHIIVRTRFVSQIDALLQAGAQEVIAEEFATSVEMFLRVLSTYLVPKNDIERFVREIRAEGYDMLRRPAVDLTCSDRQGIACSSFATHVVTVARGAFFEGKTLIESRVRNEHGLTVVAIQRGKDMTLNPDPNWVFQAGDQVHLFGEQANLTDNIDFFIQEEAK